MTRLRGRAPRGERLVASCPHGHWRTTTMIASNGALTIIELSTNTVLIEKPGGDGKAFPSPGK